METLGIQYISSILKKNGHQTKLFFDPQLFVDTVTRNFFLGNVFDYSERIIKDINDFQPDLIGFSVLSSAYNWACNLSKKLKKYFSIPIVFGGIHPTSLPEEVLRNDFVDFVIVGEGEQALLELAESKFDRKYLLAIKNLCYKSNGDIFNNPLREAIQDLDSLPFPDKDLFYDILPYLQRNYTIVTSRGCPHTCTYCCNGFLNRLYKGKFLRRRSVGNVISELKWAVGRYKIENIFFDDSTFTYDKKWLKDFSKEYKNEIGLTCFCWVHPNNVDKELIDILKLMNCKAVEMGVETLNTELRQKLFHRFYSNSTVEKAIELFNKNRIFCQVDNILGCSDNLEKEMEEFVKFYNENRPKKIYIFEYRAFPKTELATLLGEHKNSVTDSRLPFSITTVATPIRIKQMQILLVLSYFLPKRWVAFLLRRKIYHFFPNISYYNMLEILPYFLNLVKLKKFSFWYPVRGTRWRYIHYFLSDHFYFFKRLFKSWG